MRLVAVERTVKWGECDPAGVLYTPRAFDYIAEAVERWYSDVYGCDWLRMKTESNMGAPTVHTACSYRRPMAPGLAVRVAVYVERVGASSLTFRVLCESEEGLCLDGTLSSCIVAFADGTFHAAPIPAAMREKAERYREMFPI